MKIKKILILGLFVAGFLFQTASPVFAELEIISPGELEAGMKGYGKTVFSGTRIDTFDVEILGVLKKVMPGQDIILIRAESDTLHHTNILSGMSGSPIYINDKLIGALAYGWTFAKDPVAGVTPIENILKASRGEPAEGQGFKRITTPLVASGVSASGLENLTSNLNKMGMNIEIMSGGGGGETSDEQVEIAPGSALGAQLVRGDISLTAVGTVTHVDQETGQVYAFGHPFLNVGRVNLPMTTARVETVFASLMSSFKMATPLSAVGAIEEDRLASIVGRLDVEPHMIPVEVNLKRPQEDYSEAYNVDLIDNRFLTPGLINTVASSFVTQQMNQLGVNEIKTDIVIKLAGQPDVRMARLVSAGSSFDQWTFFEIAQLWENEFEAIEVEAIEIVVEARAVDRRARIVDIWSDRRYARPNDILTVYVEIDPFRSGREVISYKVRLPDPLQGGQVRFAAVPGPRLANRLPGPRNLNQLIENLNTLKQPDSLVLALEYPGISFNVEGHQLQRMPESFARQLAGTAPGDIEILPSFLKEIKITNWILSGNAEIILPTKTR